MLLQHWIAKKAKDRLTVETKGQAETVVKANGPQPTPASIHNHQSIAGILIISASSKRNSTRPLSAI